MANPVWLTQDLSNEELAQNWTLSPDDIREIRICRGAENQTRFAVQLCFVRQNGHFLDSYQTVSLKIVNHLCLQINLSPVLFLADENRPATVTSYRSRIIKYLGFASFDDKIIEKLSNHLRERAAESFQARELEEVSAQILLQWKVLLPPAKVSKKLISDAANYVQNDVFSVISQSLSAEVKQNLESLLETNNQRSELFYLKEYPPQASTKSIFRQSINWNLVAEQYDGLLRIAASLQNKTAPAHIILQRLQSSPSDNIAKALTNLGRIIKTIYILRYLSDEPLRRKIQKQLNRGENRHALAKRLFFANRGEFRTGDYEEIMNKASCLSILSNTVTIWNTLEMEKIIRGLRVGGEEILDHDLQPISPYIHQHVIPNGTCRFRDDNENGNIALNTQE